MWDTILVTIDIGKMHDRVVAEVFGEEFIVEEANSSKDPWIYAARVKSRNELGRSAIIRATYEWMDIHIPELDVGAITFACEDVEQEKVDELTRLCLVARAYLRGEGRIGQQKRFFRRDAIPVLNIEVDGLEWSLGRNFSKDPYP